jgi:hypothetical protein
MEVEKVRIKGVNSEYERNADNEVVPVTPPPGKLFLKIFICPYNQPSRMEAPSGTPVCEGTDTQCPEFGHPDPEDPNPGHAMIHLDEGDGIKLVTDGGNQIQLNQGGNILLSPTAAGSVRVNGAFVISGNVEANGAFVIKNSSGSQVVVDVSENTISLQTTTGAKILLKADGNIELFTQNNTGMVKINGNARVTGDLTVDGTIFGVLG